LKTYLIASDEGAERYAGEIGQQIELELTAREERALLAAGWLEEDKKKGGNK
jgi:hypothetical protein